MDQIDELIKRLLELDEIPHKWEDGQEIINTLVAIGEPAIKPMIYQFLGNPTLCYEDGYTVDVALALGHMGDRALKALITALHDPDPIVKEMAACALGNIGNPAAIEDLEWALWEDKSRYAVRALAEIGGDRAARNLLKAHECDLFKAPYILGHLGQTGSDLVFETLVQALADEDAHVRSCVVLSLGHLGDPNAAEYIVPLLDDPDKMVRQHAAGVLSQRLHDPRAAPVLAEDFDHKKPSHFWYTTKCIAESGNTDYNEQIYAVFASETPLHIRLRAANALILLESEYAGEAAQLIQESLKSEVSRVRFYAVAALFQKEHQFTLQWLLSLTKDPDPCTRNYLANVLGWLGNPDAIETLQTWHKTEQHATVKRTIIRSIEGLESKTTH